MTETVIVGDETITVSIPSQSALDVAPVGPESLPEQPTGLTFPAGALAITASDVTVGAVVTLQVRVETPVDTVYKLIDGVWEQFLFDGTTGAWISADGLTVTVMVRDGGRGDADGVANGIVEDPLLLGAGRNRAEYWTQLYGAQCVKYEGADLWSNDAGSISTDDDGRQFVQLAAAPPGSMYRALIIKAGSTNVSDGDPNEVYDEPVAGAAYYADDQRDVSHWIVCTQPAVAPVPPCDPAPDFGTAGTTMVNPGVNSDLSDAITDGQGRVIAIGSVQKDTNPSPNTDTLLTRLRADGAVDTTFGNSGTVELDLGAQEGDRSVAIDGLGRIVATVQQSSPDRRYSLVRLLDNGALDTSFGSGGVTQIGGNNYADAPVLVQPDGRIVVGGSLEITRYDEDGSVDLTFGASGSVATSVRPRDLALQGDGKVVALGSSGNQMVLQRFLPNGAIDTGFGSGGTVTSAFASAVGQSLVIHADGRLTAGGQSSTSSDMRLALFQVNPDGTANAAFGAAGQVITDFGPYNTETRLAVDASDRIVAVTDVVTAQTSSADIGIARYLPNGSLDTSCGGTGMKRVDFGLLEFPDAVALQPSGRIVVGYTQTTSTSRTTRTLRVSTFGG